MPWHNPDLTHLTYENADDMTWGELRVIEMDKKFKSYIKENFKLLYARIDEDVQKGLVDPRVPIAHLRLYFQTVLGEEVSPSEDPYETWQKCESKLIEEQTADDRPEDPNL